MNAKRLGKILLFGAAVGATTYCVQRLLPEVKARLGLLKAAWEATKDDLDSWTEEDAFDEPSSEEVPVIPERKMPYNVMSTGAFVAALRKSDDDEYLDALARASRAFKNTYLRDHNLK